MALFSLPPPPTSEDFKSPSWRDWFYKLQRYIMQNATNVFANLDFTGSNLTSILTRNHNDLQNIQGGTSGQYNHLTNNQDTNVGTMDSLVTGDTLYGTSTGVLNRLTGNITTTQKFLSQTGSGAVSANPSWQVVPAQGTFTYFLQDTASSIATYKKLLSVPYSPKTTLTSASLTAGAHVLQNFATDAGIPNQTFIIAGQFQLHIHTLKASGTKAAAIYAEFWEVSATGVDIGLIGTTETSTALSGIETEYNLEFDTGTNYIMASAASRVDARVYAIVSGGGSDPTVSIFYGGSADSHIALPSPTIDSTNFVPYSGATADVNLGNHQLQAFNVHEYFIAGRDGEDGNDAPIIPGRDGRDGRDGLTIPGRDGEDGDSGIILIQQTSSGGSGTVTSVSVTTANGVSGTVANSTTTPAITLTLGDITPTSINFGQTTLSYYKEGTWTPIDASGAGLTFILADSVVYTVVGNIVHLGGRITYPATANGLTALLGGFPYTVAQYAAGGIYCNTTATALLYFAGTTTAQITNISAYTNAQMSLATILFTVFYTR